MSTQPSLSDVEARLRVVEEALALPHSVSASSTSLPSLELRSQLASTQAALSKASYRAAHLARAYDANQQQIASLRAELAALRATHTPK